jgi:hypothetical protein
MERNPLDTYNFRQMIIESPDQFAVGFDIARDIQVDGEFQSVMISGMGGSALPGNLFRVYLSDLARRKKFTGERVGIFQNRFYGLPHESFDRCLNFICSYSGNTEETIASFEEAIENNLACVGFSSGGRIEGCGECFQPRESPREGVRPGAIARGPRRSPQCDPGGLSGPPAGRPPHGPPPPGQRRRLAGEATPGLRPGRAEKVQTPAEKVQIPGLRWATTESAEAVSVGLGC